MILLGCDKGQPCSVTVSYGTRGGFDRIRRANAQKHITSNTSSSQNGPAKKFGGKITRSMPSNYQDSCVHDKTHGTKGTNYKHICSACFADWGKSFVHAETQCRNISKESQLKIASEMPVPHSLGKYFQHHEI